VLFARLDAKPIERHEVTVEGFVFPTGTQWFGLSPRRDRSATVDLRATDAFWGITDRFLSSSGGLFTIQVGMFTREADTTPNGSGPSRLTPSSWQGSWFSTVSRSATRYTAVAKWERVFAGSGRSHDVTVVGEMAARRLSGRVHEQPITVASAAGQTIRA